MTPEQIRKYVMAICAHLDIRGAMTLGDSDAAIAAALIRQETIDNLASDTGQTRGQVLGRVLMCARSLG